MLVNELELAKIAVQMGVIPFYSEEKGEVVPGMNFLIDSTVLNEFLSDYGVGVEVSADKFQLKEDFIKENCRTITRARKQDMALLLSESSLLGKGHLTEELVDRIEVLNMLIGPAFEDFKDFIINGQPSSRTFIEAKTLIEKWMKEQPTDYIGLLQCRSQDSSYDKYFNTCIWADMLFQYALEDKPAEFIISEQNIDYGGVALRIKQRSLNSGTKQSFLLEIHAEDLTYSALTAWQLKAAGYEQTEPFKYSLSGIRSYKHKSMILT